MGLSLTNINTQDIIASPIVHFDDEDIIADDTFQLLPQQLHVFPHTHTVTVPTHSPAAFGLSAFASRQVQWTLPFPSSAIPPDLSDECKHLLSI